MHGHRDRLVGLARVHRLGDLGRSVVVRVAGLVEHHRAGPGAADHRERRAAVRAGAAARVGDLPARRVRGHVEARAHARGRRGVGRNRDGLARLDGSHRLGHLRRGVVVRTAGLVVLHRARAGAAHHREGVADVEADAAARERNEAAAGAGRNRE